MGVEVFRAVSHTEVTVRAVSELVWTEHVDASFNAHVSLMSSDGNFRHDVGDVGPFSCSPEDEPFPLQIFPLAPPSGQTLQF